MIDAASVLITHVTEVLKKIAGELLTRDDVKSLVDNLKKVSPAVVDELIPGQLSIGQVQRVLANLLVVPLAAPATTLGMLALAASSVSGAVGGLCFDAVWLLLVALRAVAWIAAAVPGAMVHLPAPQWTAVVAWYGALALAARIGRRPGIELDIDAILQKAVETRTAIEINAALGRLDASSEVLYRARELDVTFVVSTDAHHTRELARMEWVVLQAARGWVDPARIANTWPRKRFLAWVEERRSRRAV